MSTAERPTTGASEQVPTPSHKVYAVKNSQWTEVPAFTALFDPNNPLGPAQFLDIQVIIEPKSLLPSNEDRIKHSKVFGTDAIEVEIVDPTGKKREVRMFLNGELELSREFGGVEEGENTIVGEYVVYPSNKGKRLSGREANRYKVRLGDFVGRTPVRKFVEAAHFARLEED